MTHINQRRDTAATWTSVNPILQTGEVGWEKDTRRAKLGDGVTAWVDLAYTVADIDPALTKAAIGLGDVDNTPDIDKPISSPTQAALDLLEADITAKANIASPTFTGNPTAPTPATSDNDTSIATTAFVKAQAYAPINNPALTGNPTAPTPATTDNDTSIATTAFVKSMALVPIGAVLPYAGVNVPAGWLLCDGTTFSSLTYPTLAGRLGSHFGAVVGTAYRLPDFRNRQPVGVSTTKDVGDTGGAETHTIAVANLPNHSHTFDRQVGAYDGVGTPTNLSIGEGADASAGATTGTTGATGTALNTMDPWLAVNFIIRAV